MIDPQEVRRIVGALSREAQYAFVAYCVERCLAEARRHPAARAELERLPLLPEGLAMLWAAAAGNPPADIARARDILKHTQSYQRPNKDDSDTFFAHDVNLVFAGGVLGSGMRMLIDPDNIEIRRVAGAVGGPGRAIGTIYADSGGARDQEEHVLWLALERLRDADGRKPITPAVFDGIPDWPRGPLRKRYTAGKVTGMEDDDEE